MSTWTHVVGAFRVDGIPSMPGCFKKPQLHIRAPEGSEGPLDYDMKVYGTGLTWLRVMVWGDLRDFDDEQEIVNWLDKVCAGCMLRDGIVTIGVEGKGRFIYEWDPPESAKQSGHWRLLFEDRS